MLIKDWVWSFVFVLSPLAQIAALTKLLSKKWKLELPLLGGLSFALLLNAHFAMAVFGVKNGAVHWGLPTVSLLVLFVLRERKTFTNGEPALHLKIARLFSPHLWRRAWMWAPFPLLWISLRMLDALAPHKPYPMAAKRWAASSPELLAFSPEQLYGSLWESLAFHFFHLSRAIKNRSELEALLQVHLSSQLVHLLLGQALTIGVVAWTLGRIVEKSWNSLLHAGTPLDTRDLSHAMGMPRIIMVPAALFFGWLACSEGGLANSGVQSLNLWGSALFFTLSFLALPQTTLAGFFAGVALATQAGHFPFFIALSLLALVREPRSFHRFLIGTLAGTALWLERNFVLAGRFIYPPVLGPDLSPGWLPQSSILEHVLPPFAFSPVFAVLFTFALLGLVYLLVKTKGRPQSGWPLKFLLHSALLATLSAILAKVSGQHSRSVPTVVFAGMTVIAACLIALSSAPKSWLASVARGIPFVWLVVGFLSVPIPFHLYWQALAIKNEPPDFKLQEWTLTHVKAPDSVAWSLESEPYFASENTISQTRSTLLTRMLLKAVTPNDRIQALCDLGFRYWAAPEHNNRPELSGLSAWLKLKGKPAVRENDSFIYALRCDEP